MLITQKCWRYKASFDFCDEKLDYVFTEHFNKSGGSIAYEKIPTEWGYRKRKPMWRMKYLSCLIAIIGTFLLLGQLRFGLFNGLFIVALFGGAALFFYGLAFLEKRPKLTILQANPPLFIIHDDKYQEIMDEIAKRRTEHIRKKYMDVDFLNAPAMESQKFRFMRYQGFITEREFQDAFSKLIAAQQKPTSSIS